MDLDDIKAQMDRIFAAGMRGSTRDAAPGLREALIEFKVIVGQLREELARTEGQLDAARRDADDYERRGRLAAGIQDAETVRIAEEFLAKARERVDILERKVLVQRDELIVAEREYEVTRQRFQAARQGLPFPDESASDPALADDPETPRTGMDDFLIDQRAREAAVEAQLAHLKKKLGERG